jgi:membrane protein DedA with SNARE-associated domain
MMQTLSDIHVLAPALAGLGLAGLVLGAVLEKVFPVVPSHVLLIGLGLLCVSGTHELVVTIAACTVGSTLGSLAWYSLGRRLGAERGEAWVERFGRFIFFNADHYRKLMRAYARRSFSVTAAGQMIPAVRVYLAFPAGVLGMPIRDFAAATFLGALTWNAPLITFGYTMQGSAFDPTTWTFAQLLSR